jgi:poly(A) polymerase
MTPAMTIALPSPLIAAPVRAVMGLLNRGGAPQALFVGGCVRNAVLGETVGDIDIATILTPDIVTDILTAGGAKVIPTGIEHGTVTAVLDGAKFEITTLRRDVATDGRRAVVAFSTDWHEDAARRDFTMNTLLADADGRIFDPTGAGLADLRAGLVRFVGDPAQRVAEDHLRIMRFFRFHARYGRAAPDAAALAACALAADRITTLSRERVTDELLKILSVDNVVDILRLMFESNVLSYFAHSEYRHIDLTRLVTLQKQGGWIDPLPRLVILAAAQAEHLSFLSQYIVLPNDGWRALDLYLSVPAALPGAREAKFWIYRHGHDAARQLSCLNLACAGRDDIALDVMGLLNEWQAPSLPVNGEDVINAGIERGPQIGMVLAGIEAWWIENDFAPDRDSCLAYMEKLTA